jgi:hypothetical protein
MHGFAVDGGNDAGERNHFGEVEECQSYSSVGLVRGICWDHLRDLKLATGFEPNGPNLRIG